MSQIKPRWTRLCQQEAQTELVMLILLRLAEDVITFQTLPPQRRRDIQQTLTQNMDSIFSFMMAILRIYVEDHRKVVSGVLQLGLHSHDIKRCVDNIVVQHFNTKYLASVSKNSANLFFYLFIFSFFFPMQKGAPGHGLQVSKPHCLSEFLSEYFKVN